MITKTQIKESIDTLPDNFSIEQIIEHLIFIEKVQHGLEDSKHNRVNSTDEAKIKLKKWLK
jgi:hypothetical protein